MVVVAAIGRLLHVVAAHRRIDAIQVPLLLLLLKEVLADQGAAGAEVLGTCKEK